MYDERTPGEGEELGEGEEEMEEIEEEVGELWGDFMYHPEAGFGDVLRDG